MKKYSITILAMMTVLFIAGSSYAEIRVLSVKGTASYKAGGGWAPLTTGTALAVGSKVSTGVRSRAEIKVNNHTAPPKVGVTAKESGTYNDFTQINLGGLKTDGSDGVGEVSYIALEVADELHLLQPQPSVHISSRTPERFLKAAARVIRRGYGYPSVFNTDAVVMEQIRVGKTVEDAREGGTSGCIETGAFGKEAYILTGYLNVPKILEVTLNNGVDPLSGRTVGIATGDPRSFADFDALYAAFEKQLSHVVDTKIGVDNLLQRMFAAWMPNAAP